MKRYPLILLCGQLIFNTILSLDNNSIQSDYDKDQKPKNPHDAFPEEQVEVEVDNENTEGSTKNKQDYDNHSTVNDPLMVIEIFRAGARGPLTEPFGHEDWIKQIGAGQLTAVGERQQYILGRYLKSLYPKIFKISDEFELTEQFQVFSSDKQRTVESAQAHIYGIFDQFNGNKISQSRYLYKDQNSTVYSRFFKEKVNIKYKYALIKGIANIPIEIIPADQDKIFLKDFDNVCPRINEEHHNIHHKRHVEKKVDTSLLVTDIGVLLDKNGFSSRHLYNEASWSMNAIASFYDYLQSYEYQNAKLKDSISEGLMQNMRFIANIKILQRKWKDNLIAKIWTTNFIKLVLDKFSKAVENLKENSATPKHKQPRYIGFSADGSLTPLIMLLTKTSLFEYEKLIHEQIPKFGQGPVQDMTQYASNVIFELSRHRITGQIEGRVLFNGIPIELDLGNFDLGIENPDKYYTYKRYVDYQTNMFVLDDKKWLKFCSPITKAEKTSQWSIYLIKIQQAGLLTGGVIMKLLQCRIKNIETRIMQ